MSADTPPVDRHEPEGIELREAQVIAAGVSYFTQEEVLGPNGEPRKDAKGDPIYVTLRHEALMGDRVEMSPHEFARLESLGAVREPSDAPLPRDLPPRATPFGVPQIDPATGEATAYPGPVMGDPRPQTEFTETELLRGGPGALTPDQAADLERRAREGFGGNEGDDAAPLAWSNDTTSDDVAAHIRENSLNVEQTLALAKDESGQFDQSRAEKVLGAELEQDKPRSGVVEPLEKATGEA